MRVRNVPSRNDSFARVFAKLSTRQMHLDTRAASGPALDQNFASSLSDDAAYGRESQAVSGIWRLGGKEHFKGVGQRLLIHAAPGIGDRKLHKGKRIFLAGGAIPSLQHDFSSFGHGIARVEYEIQNDLLRPREG